MRWHQLFVRALQDMPLTIQKLKDAEIKARLAGMEITDGVHWAEQYMRDGTYKAFRMGNASKGKWQARNGELCLNDGKGNINTGKSGLVGKIGLCMPGSGLPPFDGVLHKQQLRR
jgi:hypothetical protein